MRNTDGETGGWSQGPAKDTWVRMRWRRSQRMCCGCDEVGAFNGDATPGGSTSRLLDGMPSG